MFSFLEIVPSWPIKKAHGELSAYLITHNDPLSKVSEEFRVLRTNVSNLLSENKQKAVMMTSTLKGEGKSLASSNLAISLANNSLKTVLVDCDLRRGSVHTLFNIARAPGLSELLKGKIDVDSVLASSAVEGLSIIPRGHAVSNPSELLDSKEFSALLATLKERFDVVIFDAPPVLNLPDSCIIGKYVDRSFMIVQMEHTQRTDILNAYHTLHKCKVAISGFVLTKVHNYMPKYLYDSYYGDDIYSDSIPVKGETL